MKEITLRHFFEGHATASELDADIAGTEVREGPDAGPYVSRYNVLPMDMEYSLQARDLLKLLDATVHGVLHVQHLETACSWMETGFEHFQRDANTVDGSRVADVLFWVGTPEINYPLTPATLGKMCHYLATGENLLTLADTRTVG